MTFPMWFAVPPEVPSAWLSTGMGPGPLLAAARAWHALAAQYTEIATELASVLAAVQASSWQGPSADRFVVAHQPFRYWLTQLPRWPPQQPPRTKRPPPGIRPHWGACLR